MIRARLQGRNSLLSSDLEDTFDSLGIEKVYGTPSFPIFMQMPDQNLYYLDVSKTKAHSNPYHIHLNVVINFSIKF